MGLSSTRRILPIGVFLASALFLSLCVSPLEIATASALSADTQQTPGLTLVLGHPISEQELDRYAQILELSAEQRHAVSLFGKQCLAAWDALSPRYDEVVRLSIEASKLTQNERAYDNESVSAFHRFVEAERTLARQEEKEDREFFQGVSSILTEKQQERLPRVVQHRQRSQCHAKMATLETPAARIDLSRLLEEGHLPPSALAAVDGLLREYETAITPALVQLRDLYWKEVEEFAGLVHQANFNERDELRDFSGPGHELLFRTFQAGNARLREEPARLQRRIVDANRSYFSAIRDGLPPNVASWFAEQFQKMAYPQVYPDALEVDEFYHRITDIQALDQEHRAALGAIWESYQQAFAGVSRKMEKCADDWYDHFARERDMEGYEQFRSKMRTLRDERWMRAGQLVDQMNSTLPTGAIGESTPLVRQFKSRMEQYQRIGAGDHYP